MEMMMEWTDDRAQELIDLGQLLQEAACLNRGSNVIERMQRCIALAEKLGRGDIKKGRKSFDQFLTYLCISDRSKRNQQ